MPERSAPPPRPAARLPLWLRAYVLVPRRALVWLAHAYARMAGLLTPRRTRRRRAWLRRYAALAGWPADRLDHAMRFTRALMLLDNPMVNQVLGGVLPPALEVEGEAHLRDALARGRGVVVGFDHVGLYQMVRPYLVYRGLAGMLYAVPAQAFQARHAAGDRPASLRVTQWLQRRLWWRNPTTRPVALARRVRAVLEALLRSEAVVIATDGAFGEQVGVTFLGCPVERPTGPARLALAGRAPIVMAFVVPEPGGTYRLRFHPPVIVPADLPRSEAIAQAVQEIARIVEQECLAAPWIARRVMVEAIARAEGGGG